VKAAGLTPEHVHTQLEHRFRDGGWLRESHVSILVKEFALQGISVLGEVADPSVYPRSDRRTCSTQLRQQAERRHAPEETCWSLIATRQNHLVELSLGDTVVVSRAGMVYVSGDVHTPGGFPMGQHRNLTVLEAIALARD
jgi:polysaccharide export outer membrane protein